MYNKDNEQGKYGKFSQTHFAPHGQKSSKSYGIKFAKAIEKQWGNSDDERSLFRRRMKDFETNRDYAKRYARYFNLQADIKLSRPKQRGWYVAKP